MSFEGSFDVVIEGVGAERGATVMAAPEGLYVNQHQVPYSTLLGVALRGSILLVVGTQVAMALRGGRDGLATLAAELRGRADLDHLAVTDRQALEGERVVFATPVAISGAAEMERFKGMALVVVSDSALHVFERSGRHFRTPWDRVTKVDIVQAKFGRVLRIGSGATQLEILYLTDAQIQTIRGLASRHAGALLGAATGGGAQSRATREQPASGGTATPAGPAATGPRPEPAALTDLTHRFSIPEFEIALGSVGSGSDRPMAAAIDRLQMSALLPVGFLEEHLRELRGIYDSALVKAKREAAAAPDLLAAARALGGRRLWDGVLEGVGVVADATIRAFERQTRRIAGNRRIPWRKARRRFMPTAKEAAGLRQRLTRGVTPLEESLRAVTAAAEKLRPASEAGPMELKSAYEDWQQALRELDQAYATGWTGLGREVVGLWQEAFLPKLTRLSGERRRLLPRSLKVGLYFVLFTVVVIVLLLLLFGQLGVHFE